ncbi:helix-turn-helix domain-containing protein, partial [Eubacteriales bacterium OttesenSCG-928-N13]|nr:helix-turn-helix domain-containing protein [Eubacteriales bacterium OttesenSCG-928-N13]
MIHINDLQAGIPIFKCLSSPLRVDIMEMLQEYGSMSMTEIADRLQITGGALTPHIKQLADSGLVDISLSTGKHGLQRICTANECHIVVDPARADRNANVYEAEIPVGHYTGYQALPTCGLATTEHLIGVE